jgi:U32 family peptidase
MKNKTELLSPAGNFQTLLAAIENGADSVYFGLQEFNMRARAKNFKITDLPKIKKLCEDKSTRKIPVKRYLTLNTIIYNSELKKLEKIIKKVKPYVDAIICSDLAVMLLCKKNKIPFHVSTQCSISNSEAAKFYKKLGAKRAVLARELNLKQIKEISKTIETEVFIHGAMCISVSGRCFLSQFAFNESANRGKCIQPCRRKYVLATDIQGNKLKLENKHILSPKDLCTLPFFDKLKNANIKTFKIEGRNKEPEYVATVTRVYRNALDKNLTKNEIKQSIDELNNVYNKGFSEGFYFKSPTSDDLSKIEHSSARQSKKFIGKINHYYNKIGVGLLHLNSGSLKIGDEVYIIGKTTGIIKHKLTHMQIEHKEIKQVKKSQDVGIKLPLCRKNDEVYKIIKK